MIKQQTRAREENPQYLGHLQAKPNLKCTQGTKQSEFKAQWLSFESIHGF